MSFSSDCKQELCLVKPEKPCCELSELSGLYMSMGSISLLGRGQVNVQFTCESLAVCRRTYMLLVQSLRLTPQIHYVSTTRFGGTRKCVLTLGPLQSPTFLSALHMMSKDEAGAYTLLSTMPKLALTRFCCIRAFLRGAMLGAGTMSNPDQGYHLELACSDVQLRLLLAKCFQRLDLPIHLGKRRGHAFVYLKQSDQIVTFLTAVGAHKAVMDIESLRVQRQVLGSVNRAMNCDNANLEKQMNCSDAQIAAIRNLEASSQLSALPPSLQEIAQARLSAPDASLTQLGEMLTPPIGKSGVNHRMRRLMAFAANQPISNHTPHS